MVFKLGAFRGPHFPTPSALYVILKTAPAVIRRSPPEHSAQTAQAGRRRRPGATPSISPLPSESTAQRPDNQTVMDNIAAKRGDAANAAAI